MKRLYHLILLLSLSVGCSGGLMEVQRGTNGPGGHFSITDVSQGLPDKGLWRQNVALYDVNDDGFLDIITPPPRKADPDKRRPFIFVWEPNTASWREGPYELPAIKDFDYGGIDVGDINGDGFFDLALAIHMGRIVLLLNDGKGGFVESSFAAEEKFRSRTVKIKDITGDGRLDVLAVSEARFTKDYYPRGILIGINEGGDNWNISLIEKSFGLHSDTVDITDIDNNGLMEIVVAPLTMNPEEKKLIFFFDENNEYRTHYNGSGFLEKLVPMRSGVGDFDGDGGVDIIYVISTIGRKSTKFLKAYVWDGEGLRDRSDGLPIESYTYDFTALDCNDDGKDELIFLTRKGLHIYNYGNGKWGSTFFHPMDYELNLRGTAGITAALQPDDGSCLISYNRGRELNEYNGIRGYVLKWEED
jgi:hypothetical protein